MSFVKSTASSSDVIVTFSTVSFAPSVPATVTGVETTLCPSTATSQSATVSVPDFTFRATSPVNAPAPFCATRIDEPAPPS